MLVLPIRLIFPDSTGDKEKQSLYEWAVGQLASETDSTGVDELSSFRAESNDADENGITPLMLAAKEGNEAVS